MKNITLCSITIGFLKLIVVFGVALLVFSFASCSGGKKMTKVYYNGCQMTRGYVGY